MLDGGDLKDRMWDMEGEEWRLINVFSLKLDRMVGAYCPTSDFKEAMLDQTRRNLVVENPTVEVASMKDINAWVVASAELKEAQANSNAGGRRKRRRLPLPRRKVKVVKKWRNKHDASCVLCDKGGAGLKRCYGCNVVAHKNCAQKDNQNNILCLPNKTKWWVCDGCYFDAHGGGEGNDS